MQVDIEIMFSRVSVRGKANKLTILNKSVANPQEQRELMVKSNVGPFLVKNSAVQSAEDQVRLVAEAVQRYTDLWKQKAYELEPSPEFSFTPKDWEVSQVEVNTVPSVFKAGTQTFPADITVLIENK